jgi:hypothetical protein
MSSHYVRLRRIVDKDLANSVRPLTPSLSFLPFFLLQIVLQQRSWAGWSLAISAGGAWLMFVGWRAVRLLKAGALKGDRSYDQISKFALPPEYSSTESATKARQRRGNYR